jgi:DNA-binding winged helix-turn-helix (wHTH) protein
MPVPAQGTKLFRFGPFELNSQTGELRRHGVRVRLPEQSCKVLLALLENPGELVTREDLQQQLWATGTFVDFDHGLNLAGARLRQALHDPAEQSGYIETLPRRGYRLLTHPDVEPTHAPCIEADCNGPATLARIGITRTLAWTGIAAIVAGAIVLTVWRESRTPAFLAATSLTGYVGAQLSPSFAPDGDRVAFSWAGEKQDSSIFM